MKEPDHELITTIRDQLKLSEESVWLSRINVQMEMPLGHY